jgi:hypothetical protein
MEVEEGQKIGAGELFEELDGSPLVICESKVIVPKKGKLFAEDGSMEVAIIRPCISRGKRIKGLPPIYEPAMLREHAGLFKDSPMYMDHLLAEALEEMAEDLEELSHDLFVALQERARSIKELGGRVADSWWNPDLVFEDDEEYGYQKGGVVGKVFPQPEPKKMLEADPGILQCSINAFLTGAKIGRASWDKSRRGALVEGIRRAPRPSVDWVFRGGAGGRPLLQESEDFRKAAVCVLEAAYTSDAAGDKPGRKKTKMGDKDKAKKLSELSESELQERLREEGLGELAEAVGRKPEKPAAQEGDEKPVTAGDVRAMIKEGFEQFGDSFGEKLEESSTSVEERAKEIVQERETFRSLETVANKLLAKATKNGLPESLAEEIRGRYTLFPSGASSGLKIAESDLTVEEDGKTVTKAAEEIVEARIRRDIEHGIKMLREAGADPQVEGFGASESDPNGEAEESEKERPPSAFRDFAAEEGMISVDEEAAKKDPRKAEDAAVREFVSEGVV